MAWSTLSVRVKISIAVLLCIGVIGTARPLLVSAGPITNGPGVAPFTKLGIYQGLLTIAPVRLCVGGTNPGLSCPNATECLGGGVCTVASTMEIGNAGRDIAGTGEMYIRPGSTDRSVAVRLFKAANGRAEVFLSNGSLCLGSVSGTTCRSTWPSSGGPGDTYWEEFSSTPKTCVGGRYAGIGCFDDFDCVGGGICTTQAARTSLRPSAAATPSSIRIGRPNTPIPSSSGRAVEVYGNGSTVARIGGPLEAGTRLYDEGTSRYLYLGGSISITGNLFIRNAGFSHGEFENSEPLARVYDSVDAYSNYNVTYREDGDEGSIDADTFDSSSSLPFPSYYCRKGSNPGASCVNVAGNGPNPALCLGGGECQKNDLFPLKISTDDGTGYYGRLCLKTNSSKLCAGGAATSNAGTPCTNSSQCTNGAVCINMCLSTLEQCPFHPRPTAFDTVGGYRCFGGANDQQSCTTLGTNTAECPNCTGPGCPASAKRCSNSGAVCTSSSQCGTGACILRTVGQCTAYRCHDSNQACVTKDDCGIGQGCIRGDIHSANIPLNTCGSLNCATFCRGRTACSGATAEPICGTYGTRTNYTNGEPARIDYWLGGSCGPDCSMGCPPGPYASVQICDCYVDDVATFYQARPPGSEGLLCTHNFL